MKIIFNTKELIKKVKNIAPTAEAKQTLIILGNMVFQVKNNTAQMTASDLEIEVTSSIECSSDGDCQFSLPARKLLEILNALSVYEDIVFTLSDGKVDITAGKSKISLPTLPTDDYPYMESNKDINSHDITTTELSNIINKTSFAMAYQDARHFLNGLFLNNSDGKLVSVCTDGHRLAKYTSSIDVTDDLAIIIPRKAILEINRILQSFNDNSENIVTFGYSSKNFIIDINTYRITSKVIEGSYPNYNKVIPEQTSSQITVDKSILKNSLNIISKVVNQQYKGVKLTPNQNTMHLISSNTDSEIGEDQIDVIYSGEEISIGFNISYLQDVIDILDSESVEICFNDQNSGCVIKGNNESNSIFVIMPMRV